MIDPENPFTKMQREVYARDYAGWTFAPDKRDAVVGPWEAHNSWEDYEFLFDGLDTGSMVALDYGCGPGRAVQKYLSRFRVIDGVDVDLKACQAAHFLVNCDPKCPPGKFAFFYVCNGVDLRVIDTPIYNLVYSTICLQHIPVHEIRLNLFREFFRVLNPGGWFTAQMGFGDDGDPRGVGYYENRYDATATNGGCDVKVTDVGQLSGDLAAAGFDVPGTFRAVVRPAGPADWHPNWVFFRAQKPRSDDVSPDVLGGDGDVQASAPA